MKKSTFFCCLFVHIILSLSANATHFEGGTITYKVLNTSGSFVSVLLTQTYIYDYTRIYCNDSMIANQSPKLYFNPATYLENNATVQCIENCNQTVNYTGPSVVTYCTDYSAALNITVGERSDVINLTNGSNILVAYQSRSWRQLSLPATSGSSNTTWSISCWINLQLRPDGGYNHPPVATMISPIYIPVGVQQSIFIPTIDADNDQVRCRFANGTNECGSACPPGSLPSGTILSSNCTLFITGVAVGDWYAVAIEIEDFINSSSTVPLSTVPVQFLINVQKVSSCYRRPQLTGPTSQTGGCSGIQVGQTYNIQLVAENFCPTLTTITGIATLSFPVVTKTPIVQNTTTLWSIQLTWTPTASSVGSHVLCAVAVDSNNVQSNQYCMTFTVAEGSVPSCPGASTTTTTTTTTTTSTTTTKPTTTTTTTSTTTSTTITTSTTTEITTTAAPTATILVTTITTTTDTTGSTISSSFTATTTTTITTTTATSTIVATTSTTTTTTTDTTEETISSSSTTTTTTITTTATSTTRSTTTLTTDTAEETISSSLAATTSTTTTTTTSSFITTTVTTVSGMATITSTSSTTPTVTTTTTITVATTTSITTTSTLTFSFSASGATSVNFPNFGYTTYTTTISSTAESSTGDVTTSQSSSSSVASSSSDSSSSWLWIAALIAALALILLALCLCCCCWHFCPGCCRWKRQKRRSSIAVSQDENGHLQSSYPSPLVSNAFERDVPLHDDLFLAIRRSSMTSSRNPDDIQLSAPGSARSAKPTPHYAIALRRNPRVAPMSPLNRSIASNTLSSASLFGSR